MISPILWGLLGLHLLFTYYTFGEYVTRWAETHFGPPPKDVPPPVMFLLWPASAFCVFMHCREEKCPWFLPPEETSIDDMDIVQVIERLANGPPG